MTSFEGGPADGQTLSLHAARFYLRVTENPRARKYRFDALDQPRDVAEPHELIYIYQLTAEPNWYHLKGSKGISGYWPQATYRYWNEQPEQAVLRDEAQWREWVKTQPIGPVRAAKLEAHLESLGLRNVLHFTHSWCRWSHESLAELTEAAGLELIKEAKKAVKQLGVKLPETIEEPELLATGKVYDIPAKATFRPCQACRTPITFIKTVTGASLPVTKAGTSHYLDCNDPKRFSKGVKSC